MSLAAMVLADRSAPLVRHYDRWVELVTLGGAARARSAVLGSVAPGRLLDLGCGTGSLAIAAARAGVRVVAIDRSAAMLDVARKKARVADVSVDWREGDLSFPPLDPEPFDTVTACFSLSELPSDLAAIAVRRAAEALRPGGRLVIADEVAPRAAWHRALVAVPRALLATVSFAILERYAPTHRHPWRALAEEAGLEVASVTAVSATLDVLVATRPATLPTATRALPPLEGALPVGARGAARRAAAWIGLPIAVAPGVYRIGEPPRDAPVLLTGNFLSSVLAVRDGLAGHDAFVVVEDSEGWNVWCASDAGLFTAERGAALIELSGLAESLVAHRIIVPRLGGRVGRRLADLTGWETVVGPLEARDLTQFLAHGMDREMRSLARMYGMRERLRVASMTAIQLPLYLLPLRLLPREWRRGTGAAALLEALVLPVAHDRLPGPTGVVKGAALGVVAALGGIVSGRTGIRGALTTLAIAPFVGWVYQSTSPVVFWRRLFR